MGGAVRQPAVDEGTLVDFFRDGWLAPITADAPLAMEERLTVETIVEESPPETLVENVEPEDAPNKKSRQAAKSRSLHKRYRARLRRRKSNRCFIDSAWTVYRQTAERLAEALLKRRSPRTRSNTTAGTPTFRETASSFRKDVTSFLNEVSRRIAGLCSGSETDHPVRAGPRKTR